MKKLSSHLNARGEARMVDVGDKPITSRLATARAVLTMSAVTLGRLRRGDTPKGDVLATARIAGIQAAKRTPELIPLCHSIALSSVEIDIAIGKQAVTIDARAEARDRTGVEMEAMVAASVAALTMYDMLKGIDRGIRYSVELVLKAGGKSGLEADLMLIDLRTTALSVDEVIAHVSHSGAGGVSVFLGVVRDLNEGRAVTRLEYEAYDGMARAEMARIATSLEQATPGLRVAALHRTGSLAVGELAVVCAASAPHHSEAFLGCRALIDGIKASVPIWKREHGPDGAAWVGWVDARCHADHGHR